MYICRKIYLGKKLRFFIISFIRIKTQWKYKGYFCCFNWKPGCIALISWILANYWKLCVKCFFSAFLFHIQLDIFNIHRRKKESIKKTYKNVLENWNLRFFCFITSIFYPIAGITKKTSFSKTLYFRVDLKN